MPHLLSGHVKLLHVYNSTDIHQFLYFHLYMIVCEFVMYITKIAGI